MKKYRIAMALELIPVEPFGSFSENVNHYARNSFMMYLLRFCSQYSQVFVMSTL